MGDRNNPIKFGPEWLRNLPGERREPTTPGGIQSGVTGTGGGGGGTPTTSPSNNLQSNSNAATSAYHSPASANMPKVLLAKLRYGKEEMLALYERNLSPPPELKNFELLYQPRGQSPVAFSNTFGDEMRENIRNIPSAAMASNDRYGASNNRFRGINLARSLCMVDSRGRRGSSSIRPTCARGSFHSSSHRGSGFNIEEDPNTAVRPWVSPSTSNGQGLPNRNNNTDNADWATKMYRIKRPGATTNWRQSSRDDSEEWRSTDTRNRGLDKWERDSGEKRRIYIWDVVNSDDTLPEWAVENTEAFGGSFDASGAFHGYSNDDSNLPKSQESSYPLTKSQTHGNFTRSKTVEEGSEEWWSSEKAKKLSPKRFEANLKFNKQHSTGSADASPNNNGNSSKPNIFDEEPMRDVPEKPLSTSPATEEQNTKNGNGKYKNKKKFTESKTFDALMRSDINIEDAGGDERGNFQSVMLTPNNSLRQKHQNIVTSAKDQMKQNQRGMRIIQGTPKGQPQPQDKVTPIKTPEKNIVEDMFGLTLDSNNFYNLPQMAEPSSSRDKDTVAKVEPQLPNSMQMGKNSLDNSDHEPLKTLSGETSTMKRPEMPQIGMQNSALNASLGLNLDHPSLGAYLMQGVPQPIIPTGVNKQNMTSALPGGLGASAMAGLGSNVMPSGMTPNMASAMTQNMASGITPGMQSGITPGMASGMTPGMASGISPGMASGMTPGMPSGISPGMASGITPGMAPGISPGMASGMNTMTGFQGNANMSGMSAANDASSSLFFNQNNNGLVPMSSPIQINSPGDLQMANQLGSNMYSMHGMQQPNPQAVFGNSIYSNMIQQPQSSMNQWYYEDPKDMLNAPFSMPGFEQHPQNAHNNLLNPQSSLGSDVRHRPPINYNRNGNVIQNMPNVANMPNNMQNMPNNMHNMPSMYNHNVANLPPAANMTNYSTMPPNMANVQHSVNTSSIPLHSVNPIRMMGQPLHGQPPPMVESVWGQSGLSANNFMWMQQPMNTPNNMQVNKLPMYFWGNEPSAVASNTLLPEIVTKEMKTEDEILAHLRASQPPFIDPPVSTTLSKTPDTFANVSATPNLEELQKLMQVPPPPINKKMNENIEEQAALEKLPTTDPTAPDLTEPAKPQQVPVKSADSKTAKPTKTDVESKTVKSKENNNAKSKSKKMKEEKKEEPAETKAKDEEAPKTERRSAEPSPSQSKKEDKLNVTAVKKGLEKEKKDWIKEGFTIVKGTDKTAKETKKKAEEARATEEAERKRKEEERIVAEEEKKKKQAEALKKQQQQQENQNTRQAVESVNRKAPWSAVANQAMQSTNKDGLSLAEIQRLEREKKLEQMKEQQQMMQIIAQQQAAALAREQEMQAGVGWAKKKLNNPTQAGPSLPDIQADTWKQAAALAAAITEQVLDEPPTSNIAPAQTNHVAPWANAQNGGGFWDTQPNQQQKQDKSQEGPKPAEPLKVKKKVTPIIVKKENSPTVDFENWCTSVLSSWSSKIDVPTFVGFLKDIESPYEVKDYVRCYLGDTKESSDFSRQFLERRSKLLRVGMVTPSDDLCSPAIAVNPRTLSSSDYQEVKGKGKKPKKNKMLKVDARILGFSVTAAEDRINVGDIDTV